MADRDENGVDILDRFKAYKSRFMQWSVTEEVFLQVVDYIVELRKERDSARRMYCRTIAYHMPSYGSAEQIANNKKWDCFKENKQWNTM